MKIGHVIEIGKVLHEILIKIATEENSAPKKISKKVPITTAKVLDYMHGSITVFLFLVDCALEKFYKDDQNMPIVSFTNLELRDIFKICIGRVSDNLICKKRPYRVKTQPLLFQIRKKQI